MAKLIFRIFIFSTPFFLLLLLELFVVPFGAFNFRSWEAFRPKQFFSALPGPFYPNKYLEKVEKGDLGPHTKFAVFKNVVWQTDKYGYRTSNNSSYHDVVIVGDSNIVGSGMSQEDILSEVLEKKSQLSVYPYSPSRIEYFLSEDRFKNDNPKIVILSCVERELNGVFLPAKALISPDENIFDRTYNPFLSYLDGKLRNNAFGVKLVAFLDQALNPNIFRFIRSEITGEVPAPLYTYASGKTLFFQGEAANKDVSSEDIEKISDFVEKLRDDLNERGIHIIFLPIPNKENIYYKMLPSQKKPVFLRDLISELNKRNIDLIDTQTLFEDAYEKQGIKPYHTDDTHWNSNGVKIASDELMKHINKQMQANEITNGN